MTTRSEFPAVRRPGRRIRVAAGAAAALAVAVAGCSNGSGGSTGGSSGSGGSAPVPKATGDAVSAQPTSLGTILVDGRARTVYDFANDTTAVSTCTGTCAANWLFVPAPNPLPTSLPGVTGKLGASTRPDGGRQLTVAGHPVYTFAGDSAPGDAHGQGQVLNGGLWTVVSPSGTPLPDARPAGATQNPGGITY
jgi:predicted lipoprotein with Yx(FWY)xxD motif